HDAIGDRETEPGAAKVIRSVRSGLNAVKRQEDVREHSVRNARSMIADAQEDRSALALDRDLDRCSRRGVAHGVSNNILDRTAYQLRHTRHRATLICQETHGSVLRTRFEVAIGYDFLH